jgi:hypothetical protein
MPTMSRKHTRQILGAPLVPPPGLTRLVTSVRKGLLGAHRRSAPPSLRVLEAVFGLFDNRVLGLLVELDVPELLDRPRSVAELADATGTRVDGLDRVLRLRRRPGVHRLRAGWPLPGQRPDEHPAARQRQLVAGLASGRERTAARFDRLFAGAGLDLIERVPLATGFSAFRLRTGAGGV